MIQPTYKKGNRLVWTGFLLGIAFGISAYLGTPSGNNAFFVPSLQSLVPIFIMGRIVCIALIVWGCVLALKAKNRSLWWMLLIVPALGGLGGMIFVVILFALKDKSVIPRL